MPLVAKTEDRFIISNKLFGKSSEKWLKFGLALFFVIGLFLMLVAVAILIGGEIDYGITIMGLFFTLFPIIFKLNASVMDPKSVNGYVAFDRRQQEVLFSRRKRRGVAFKFPFSEVAYLYILEQRHAAPNKLIYYSVFCILKDGSEVWIDDFANADALTEFVGELTGYTGFALKDGTKLGLNRKQAAHYDAVDTSIEHLKPQQTKMVLEETPSSIRISFKKSSSPLKVKLLYVLIWLLLTGLPGLKIMQLISEAGSEGLDGSGWAGVIFLSFFIVLCSFFLLWGLAIAYRHYRLTVESGRLLVEMSHTTSAFVKQYRHSLEIPAKYIQYIRINREQWGNFYLGLVMSKSFRVPKESKSAIPLIGSFTKSNISKSLDPNTRVIPIWESLVYHRVGQGISVDDLLYVKHLIKDKIGLKEKEIG